VHVDATGSEACSLVDLDRPLVERRHGEDEPFRREPPARELEPGGEERSSEAAAGKVWYTTEWLSETSYRSTVWYVGIYQSGEDTFSDLAKGTSRSFEPTC
jgi:hypothetical protein